MIYDNNVSLKVARDITLLLSLRLGVTRDEVLTYEELTRRLEQVQSQVRKQRQTIENQKRRIEQQNRIIENQKRQAGKQRPAAKNKESAKDPGSVSYEGLDLPPKNLRPCGLGFQDDEVYVSSARRTVDFLVQRLGLGPNSSLLDVGSGPGRIAIGILDRVGEIREYRGIDVVKEYVLWGQRHITPKHPNFQFAHFDMENTRYNPAGNQTEQALRLPFEDNEFDIICLYSVFTHMLTEGVSFYLKEFRRILHPDGRVYFTAFLEDGVPDVEENPQGYTGREWKGPLHCVRYNKEFFDKLLDEHGFQIIDVDYHGRRPVFKKGKDRGHCGWIAARKA